MMGDSASISCHILILGKKKEHKLKLLVPDIFRSGGGLQREGVGAKKFGMSLETHGNQTLWRDHVLGFLPPHPGGLAFSDRDLI